MCVWGVTTCRSALVCDSSSVWVCPRRSSLRSPSGSADKVVTHKDSIIIRQKMSVYPGQSTHEGSGNFLHNCITTRLSRFHGEETEQGFINQHIRSLRHSCSCLCVWLWWIIMLCWFTQRPGVIHRFMFRQHNANELSINVASNTGKQALHVTWKQLISGTPFLLFLNRFKIKWKFKIIFSAKTLI